MEGYVVLTVRFCGSCKLISINPQSSYKYIILKIQQNWSHIDQDTVRLSCNVGATTEVSLRSQVDLINLLMLCEISGVRLVTVDVLEMYPSNKSVSPPLNLNVGSNFCGPLPCCDSESPYSPVFVSQAINNVSLNVHDSTPLLSKRWADVFSSGVGSRVAGNAADFRIALLKYSFSIGFQFKYRRNTRFRIIAYCSDIKNVGCNWLIKAKPDSVGHSFVVYEIGSQHLCIDKLSSCPSSKNLSAPMIADLLKHHVRKNPKLKPKDAVDAIMIGYGVELPYWKARRAAVSAKRKLCGSFIESYDYISSYLEVLLISNPGSVVKLEINKTSSVFERVFVAFNSSLKGFESCLPILFVDGTFLRGRVKGTLMVATAKDGNNGLFPVAFAVVSAENTDNWAWFLALLRDNVSHPKNISYLSDRNTGLLAALPIVFDQPSHFFCLVHLLTNLKGRFTGSSNKEIRSILVKLFRECAYASNKDVFAAKLQIFRDVGGLAAEEWLSMLPFDKWALSYTPNLSRYGEMTSNAVESFNSWILEARAKPITQMVDHIRSGLSRWVVQRRALSDSWNGTLVPMKEVCWEHLASMGSRWNVVLCPAGDYEVLSSPSVRVDLSTRTCSCYQWQHTGFPCCHAITVIKKVRESVNLDVDECYFVSNYRKCYSWDLNPVPEALMIEKWRNKTQGVVTGPPVLSRPPGRPKLPKRISSFGEFSRVQKKFMFCHRCHKVGNHDDFTCGLNNSDVNASKC